MSLQTVLWNTYATAYDKSALNFSAYRLLMSELRDLVIATSKSKILNVGCGTGNLEKEVSSIKGLKFDWLGTDISTSMLNRAKSKITNLGFNFVIHDLNKSFVVLNRKFDLIIFVHSLYVANDIKQTMQYAKEVLHPRGKVIIVNPKKDANYKNLAKLEFKNLGTLRFIWLLIRVFPALIINMVIQKLAGSGRYKFLTHDELENTLFSLGFIIEKNYDVYAGQSELIQATLSE